MRLPSKTETKLLIIPEKDINEYDVMVLAEETCELVGTRKNTVKLDLNFVFRLKWDHHNHVFNIVPRDKEQDQKGN